jgi:hypothetical protein
MIFLPNYHTGKGSSKREERQMLRQLRSWCYLVGKEDKFLITPYQKVRLIVSWNSIKMMIKFWIR